MKKSLCVVMAIALLSISAAAQTRLPSSLDVGFQKLYNLDFAGAQREFATFQQNQPDNPMGPAAEAAGYLFSELSRLGVLESEFFTDDSAFRSRTKLAADLVVRQRFTNALERTGTLVTRRLSNTPTDRDALLAQTLAAGLRADYASLIENRNMAALRLTRDATASARQLLDVCPNCYDAYVATGISEYLIGTLSAPVRWIVRLGGYSGNKEQGIAHLRLVAERGHYLAPFARILLAIAYVREKHPEEARRVLAQLQTEFPGNPLFREELARLEKH